MLPVSMATAGQRLSLHELTRRHAIKLSPPDGCSVEECSLAVGEIVGYESIKSASKMNSAVVIFLDNVDKVNQLLVSGLVIHDTYTPVLSLVSPAKKVVISNVPPFLKNELLERELGRHGKLVSQIKMIPFSCKSPHLKHVVSFRRQVQMILKNSNEELNLVFKFKVDDYEYTVHVTSETMKCFGCGSVGHQIRLCPERVVGSRAAANVIEPPLVRAERRASLPDKAQEIVQEESRDDISQENEGRESATCENEVQDDLKEDSNVGQTATRVAESVLSNEDEVLMDVNVSKLSTKRKKTENKSNVDQVIKISKMVEMSSSQSDDGLMNTQESNCSENTQFDVKTAYSLNKIQSFLQTTKGMRSVKVEDYFSDLKLFLESVKYFTKNTEGPDQSTFTDQEVFRLKKIALKVRTQIASDD